MRFLITIWLLIQTGLLFGQTFSVSGKIANAGEPVVEGVVMLEGKNLNTPISQYGEYILNGIKPGNYNIVVFAFGFETTSKSISVTNENLKLNFDLEELQNELEEFVVSAKEEYSFGVSRLKSVEGVTINEAKKSEVIIPENIVANKGANNARQIYSRVPGLNIWESDGAGVQLGIGGRGLSPNRSSNFNTRQNGYDIAADALGYPESYYTPPTQAVERIEIVRGAASLQYGTQFGGMVNFKMKEGSDVEKIDFKSLQTVGSFGLFNTFNSIGGTVGKFKYYTYYNYKRSNGWRPNSKLDQNNLYTALEYKFTPATSVRVEYTLMDYLAKQPGGLTDSEFEQNPRQSKRERNWFQVNWNLVAAVFDHRFNSNFKINSRFFGLFAGRDALGNLDRIDRPDDVTQNRDLISDDFKNIGNETRLITNYKIGGKQSVLLVGGRFYKGFTNRRQGEADNSFDPNFSFLNPDRLEGSDYDLPSTNNAFFAENIFNITDKFSITPGIRYEFISTSADGYYRETLNDLAGNIINDTLIYEDKTNKRSFIFGGIGLSYKPKKYLEIYSSFSQNYRAINFNDLRLNVSTLVVDQALRDEKGFNLDLGARGEISKKIQYDVSLFYLYYNDKIGNKLETVADPNFNFFVPKAVRVRSNISAAITYGVEFFAETNILSFLPYEGRARLDWFINFSLIDSKYDEAGDVLTAGNKVELVPQVNIKSGLTYKRGNLGVSLQYTFVEEHFSDATNAQRTPTAVEGIIPAYQILDLSIKYKFRNYEVQMGSNNLTDTRYFTRRAVGYPGPGIIPSDGRSFYLTLGFDF